MKLPYSDPDCHLQPAASAKVPVELGSSAGSGSQPELLNGYNRSIRKGLSRVRVFGQGHSCWRAPLRFSAIAHQELYSVLVRNKPQTSVSEMSSPIEEL